MIALIRTCTIRLGAFTLFCGTLWGMMIGAQALQTVYSQPMTMGESNTPRSYHMSFWKNCPDPGEPTRYQEYRLPHSNN